MTITKSLILHKVVFFLLMLAVFWLSPLIDSFYLRDTPSNLTLLFLFIVVVIDVIAVLFITRISGISLQKMPPILNLSVIFLAFFMSSVTLGSVITIHGIGNLLMLWQFSLSIFLTSLSFYVFFNVLIYAMLGYILFRAFSLDGVKRRYILILNLVEIVAFDLLVFNFSPFGGLPLGF